VNTQNNNWNTGAADIYNKVTLPLHTVTFYTTRDAKVPGYSKLNKTLTLRHQNEINQTQRQQSHGNTKAKTHFVTASQIG